MKKLMVFLYVFIALKVFCIDYQIIYSKDGGQIYIFNRNINVQILSSQDTNSDIYFLLFSEKIVRMLKEVSEFFPENSISKCRSIFYFPTVLYENNKEISKKIYTKVGENSYSVRKKNIFSFNLNPTSFNFFSFRLNLHEILESLLHDVSNFNNVSEESRKTRWFFDGMVEFYSRYFVLKISENMNYIFDFKSSYKKVKKNKLQNLKNFIYPTLYKSSNDLGSPSPKEREKLIEKKLEKAVKKRAKSEHADEIKAYPCSEMIILYISYNDPEKFLKEIIKRLQVYGKPINNLYLFKIIKEITGYNVEPWYNDYPKFWKKHRKEIKRMIYKKEK